MSFLPFFRDGTQPLVCERKFVGPLLAATRAEAVLRARCAPDAGHPAGKIRSIYFDTPDLSAWAEKDNGDALKRKIRVRWYDDDEPSPDGTLRAYLEVKYRVCAARRKTRAVVSVPAEWIRAVPLSDPSLPAFLAAHEAELGEPAAGWSPVCCIGYDRLRFDDPLGGSRVALDRDIRADRINLARFPWARPVVLDAAVCEFKNPGGVPPAWAEDVRDAGMRLRSFSKFGEIMQRLAEAKI